MWRLAVCAVLLGACTDLDGDVCLWVEAGECAGSSGGAWTEEWHEYDGASAAVIGGQLRVVLTSSELDQYEIESYTLSFADESVSAPSVLLEDAESVGLAALGEEGLFAWHDRRTGDYHTAVMRSDGSLAMETALTWKWIRDIYAVGDRYLVRASEEDVWVDASGAIIAPFVGPRGYPPAISGSRMAYATIDFQTLHLVTLDSPDAVPREFHLSDHALSGDINPVVTFTRDGILIVYGYLDPTIRITAARFDVQGKQLLEERPYAAEFMELVPQGDHVIGLVDDNQGLGAKFVTNDGEAMPTVAPVLEAYVTGRYAFQVLDLGDEMVAIKRHRAIRAVRFDADGRIGEPLRIATSYIIE